MKQSDPNRLGRWWQTAHANHHRIVHGLMSIGAFLVVARLVAAAKEVVVAAHYGTSAVVDAYLIALTIATWLPTVLVSVAIWVLVPKLVALRTQSGDHAAFISELNGTTLILAALLTAMTAIAGPLIVPWVARGMSLANQATTQLMVLQLSPLAALTLAAGLMAVRLQASQRHGYALAEAGPALGILVFVWLFLQGNEAGPLLLGTLVGSAAQVLWSGRMSHRADGTLGGLAYRRQSPEWKNLYGAVWIMGISSLSMALAVPVDQFFATALGEGAVAALGYANRIVALAIGLGAVAIGRAMLPVLCNAVAAGQRDLARKQAERWAWLTLAVGAIAATVGWWLAPWGVALLFERGSFTPADTQVVSEVLRVLLLQLPFYFGGIVLSQWLTAIGNHRTLLCVAIAAILTKVALNAVLIESQGLAGIAMSTSAMYALWFLMQFALTHRRGGT